MTQATEAVWMRPAQEYREETRSFEDLEFRVTRRSLTFLEETRILAASRNPDKTYDMLEVLARTVDASMKESSFGLTADRVRRELAERSSLAWFLIKWLCAETIANTAPDALEAARKKLGP